MPSSAGTASILADVSRSSTVAHRGLRELVEQRLAVGEVAIDGGAGDAGGRRHVVHVRLVALQREDVRRAVEDRDGDALLQRLAGRCVW